ncbi:Pr6Pr family membrane protein [Pelagibacterium halotolerans]|uniref:Integral membrane protein n=1 Tax=Pelagibacterium halotolerans (strain DSM 22347 / JCM 15775 / CGMCC 1.7692 / B2) TaxID=1082931 RepID=G4RE69_PELHB|nr:Pr6Pr family membrane protein [Pelagibacterium halotolerans]AEQ51833.1 integral membrane protein [Pelagibacterium halotolerans B2]QJR18359.1 Pr6Pr family membrane protein [Pelagibacterium halotolerans]
MLLAAVGLANGLVAIGLQWSLSMPALYGTGHNFLTANIHFLSYLTILSNTGLILAYAGTLFPVKPLAWARHPVMRGMMAGVITLVMIFYHFLLAPLQDFEGPHLLATTLLHYVAPTLYIVWWIGFVPHGQLAWRNLPLMLVPTLIYFLYTLARGALVAEYPYPPLDVAALGYERVLVNALMVAVGLAVLCMFAIFLDRLLGRKNPIAP